MVSPRTIYSLSQYLVLQPSGNVRILLSKHTIDISALSPDPYSDQTFLEKLSNCLLRANQGFLLSLLREIFKTQADLQSYVDYRTRHDQRRDDLIACLELDGYKLEYDELVPIDPTIEDDPPVENHLSKELAQSGLHQADNILDMLNKSADAFRRVPPDYNACLTEARVALQSLAVAIAKARTTTHPGSFDETNWSQVSGYLQSSGLITDAETKGIKGVFGFVSPGAHTSVGSTEQEMARLGRSLVASMCYFLVKRYNQ